MSYQHIRSRITTNSPAKDKFFNAKALRELKRAGKSFSKSDLAAEITHIEEKIQDSSISSQDQYFLSMALSELENIDEPFETTTETTQQTTSGGTTTSTTIEITGGDLTPIMHNMGSQYVNVSVFDKSTGKMVIPDEIIVINSNQLNVDLSSYEAIPYKVVIQNQGSEYTLDIIPKPATIEEINTGTVDNTYVSPNILVKSNPLFQDNIKFAEGKGIDFGASGGNVLTDYEEGSWTPTLVNGGTLTNMNPNSSRYIKIGNLVSLWMYVGVAGVPNTNSEFVIAGLPYVGDGIDTYGAGSVSFVGAFNWVSIGNPSPLVHHTNNNIYFHKRNGVNRSVLCNEVTTLPYLIIQISYRSAS